MKDLFKNVMYTGIGLISYQAKKVNKVLREDILDPITENAALLNFERFEVVGLNEEELKIELTTNN